MKKRVGFGVLLLALLAPWQVWGWQPATHTCPYLDRRRPMYTLDVGLVPDAKTETTDYKYSELQIDLAADLIYLHNILDGDMDFALRLDSVFPLRDTMDFLPPDHMVEFVLETRWFWRFVNNTGIELTLEPGLYADTSDLLDMPIAMPITVAGVYSATPRLAGVAGLSVRPGFNRLFMPLVGVVWEPQPELRVEGLLPEGLVTWHIDRHWSAHLGWDWDSTTYAVEPNADGRDRFTSESKTLYAGGTYRIDDERRIHASLGWITDRRIRKTLSRDDQRQTTDIEDSILLRIGMAGAF